MSNDDKRRRRDGATAQLSVADLIARREAETQPIPRITDEETVRFAPGRDLSGRELHITELLRREGRAGEEERGGGLSVPKLVAMASGGVVLAGAVAFTATNLLSSPDERPLAEVRFDTRPAARSTNTVGNDLVAAAKQQQAPQTTDQTETSSSTATTTTTTKRQRATQQPAPPAATTTEQAPTTEQPPTTDHPPSTTTPPTTQPPAPPSSTGNPPPSSDSTTPPPSTGTQPSTPPSTPPSTRPSTPPPSEAPGIGIGIDLGGILEPIGGFDFFAPAQQQR
ncbi:hypothetical protein [Saccharothrix australiensis]|uniref:Uncharacterized protein n=1 Tax=Saccharothrix australiensis TaxID=2072 RepID=A0A495W8X8_9PSEU|nr:hypothetical protein [Saccharothrix australiensis]RKT57664.1 hypothetical protein C8E97_6389 [Saccharothrix australiensis]